ncbi:MAG: hypothetical protein ABI758_00835 [Candidatus Woesebacteria bacterium]
MPTTTEVHATVGDVVEYTSYDKKGTHQAQIIAFINLGVSESINIVLAPPDPGQPVGPTLAVYDSETKKIDTPPTRRPLKTTEMLVQIMSANHNFLKVILKSNRE